MPDVVRVGSNAKSLDKSESFDVYDMVIINTSDDTFISCPSVNIVKATWTGKGLQDGIYEFSYDGSHWKLNGTNVTLSSYGITPVYQSSAAKYGDKIIVEQITATIGGNTEVSVKPRMTRSGRCLEVENPWGTVEMANDMLERMANFHYQPYNADGALFTPAAELGDVIKFTNLLGGLYNQDITFNGLMASDVSAPWEEEIDSEFPYSSPQERKYKRQYSETRASLEILGNRITAEVSERTASDEEFSSALELTAETIELEVQARINGDDELSSQIEETAEYIRASVMSKSGGTQSSFAWELTDSSWTLYSNSSTVLKATKDGIEITGKVVATSGTIGGASIVNGVLTVGAAQIGTVYADAIVQRSGGNWITGSQIAYGTVTYGNTAFTSTLDLVGTNSANIATLANAYVNLSAQVASISAGYFYSISTSQIAFGNYYLYVDGVYVKARAIG